MSERRHHFPGGVSVFNLATYVNSLVCLQKYKFSMKIEEKYASKALEYIDSVQNHHFPRRLYHVLRVLKYIIANIKLHEISEDLLYMQNHMTFLEEETCMIEINIYELYMMENNLGLCWRIELED